MYWYLSFLRPPPVSLALPSDGVVITPQVANDLRTELRTTPTPIHYTWQRVSPPLAPTKPVDLTVFEPPASTYRPLTVPLPRSARPGEKWRLGLLAPPATSPEGIPLLALSDGDPGVLGVWSEGIELKSGGEVAVGSVRGVGGDKKGGKAQAKDKKSAGAGKKDKEDKKKRDDTPKQTRITRSWPHAAGELKLVEQTSFDLDKKVWDSGLALASWLHRHLDGKHGNASARTVLGLLRDGATVLEIGSGTGLVSIALAQVRRARITATDLDSAMEIMEENVAYNGVNVSARVLDWDVEIPPWVQEDWPHVVLAADVTYNTASFPCLVRTLDALLGPYGERPAPPLLIAYKQRDVAERDLWELLKEKGIEAEMVDRVQGAEDVGETEIWVMRRV